MMKTMNTCCILILLAALCVVTTRSSDDTAELPCTTGLDCFPYGVVSGSQPSPTNLNYYCCLDRNRQAKKSLLADGTYNCSCKLNLTMESEVIERARDTRNYGRMCVRNEGCDGTDHVGITGDRFKDCCLGSDEKVWSEITVMVDGDKEEFIVCRCGTPLPTPDPKAYVVPPVEMYNSTGESCFYDKACQDHPASECKKDNVTFCCYGSRGLVTENDDREQITRCTCTDEVFGPKCEARPKAIADTRLSCLTDCANTADEDKCTDDNNAERCCPHNMAVVASQSGGNFTSCTCQAGAKKNCGQTSVAIRSGGRLDVVLFAAGALLVGRFRR